MIDLRLPNIKGNDKEQLVQIRSYLYQLTEQLQWALNNISASIPTNVTPQTTPRVTAPSSQPFDTEVAFDALKPLIIKSADIVQAYYEEINSILSGVYVAESDFGTFVEETEQEIRQSSTGIEQLFTNVQQIFTGIDNLNFALAEVNGRIRTGVLEEKDGIPIYGLEIGQETTIDGEKAFNKYARFTADRLSFYDQNDNEVAYVSDYKLYIKNVEITNSFKIGGFVETVIAGGDVVTKWVGGDG